MILLKPRLLFDAAALGLKFRLISDIAQGLRLLAPGSLDAVSGLELRPSSDAASLLQGWNLGHSLTLLKV